MRFGVLGPPAVWTDDGTPVRVPEVKVRALLTVLMSHEGRPVPVDRLVIDLWGEDPPRDPSHSIQTKVSQLRRTLERAETGARGLLVRDPAGYLLRLGPDALDVARFRDLAARARATEDPRARASLSGAALALWRGPVPADVEEIDSLRPWVARLEEERLAVVEDRAEQRLRLGEHVPLAAELAEEVAAHPFRERMCALLMRALYGAGRQTEALEVYHRLRERLAEELGADPQPEVVAVFHGVLGHDTVLEEFSTAPDAPSTTVSPRRATNLGAPPTALVGRSEELGRVRGLLAGRGPVTLTGPGGVGKTRLALEVARERVGEHRDGVWMVELAGSRGTTEHDVEVVAGAVATAVGVRPGRGGDPARTLAAAVADKDMLLVLDNCEHVVEGAAAVAGALTREAPGVRVLATGREPLGLRGETLVAVAPLKAPPVELADEDPDALDPYPSVRLLTERIADSTPGFVMDSTTAPAVAAVCRRLDGLPLALELAATRVRALGVREVAARLDDRFALLTGGHRDAPSRQRTLRAVIDWSWETLPEGERAVLRRLAVFAGGCGLEGAEEVCSGDGVGRAEVADALGRLVDRSLVTVVDTGTGLRYRLLESVAAYGLERLAGAGEVEALRDAHLRHLTALAERIEPLLRGHGQRGALSRLDAETANLRAALDHAVAGGDAGMALRLVNALAWYWHLRARYTEGRRSLETALESGGDPRLRARAQGWRVGLAIVEGRATGRGAEAAEVAAAFDGTDDPLGRARAEWYLALNITGDGDTGEKRRMVDRALEVSRSRNDEWGIAAALAVRALYTLVRGDLAAAAHDGEEALRRFRDLGDAWGELQAGDSVAMLAEIGGDHERAGRLHEEGLRIAEEFGLQIEVAWRTAQLGRIALLTGDHGRADEMHERARRLAARQGYSWVEMFAEIGLALAERRRGELDSAVGRLESWHHRLSGDDPTTAFIRAELGFIAELRGDGERAHESHTRGYEAARGDTRAEALALEGLAGAHALLGRATTAAVLLGAAVAKRASVGAPLPDAERGDVDRITERARSALGAGGFAVAFEEGRSADAETVDGLATASMDEA
ncbi:BTAD domain-containing putative transcriptional regulator [Nocardiopsis alba]|uniref:BTAD domain-containing putative transcriptional regulator n=1 Tax=Nocardiopsis alba TaxID=53437 RepID=UPI0033E1657E